MLVGSRRLIRNYIDFGKDLHYFIKSCCYSKANKHVYEQPRFERLAVGPSLKDFLQSAVGEQTTFTSKSSFEKEKRLKECSHPYLPKSTFFGNGRRVYFETYGCQMNVSDTEIAWAILEKNGFEKVQSVDDADVVLIVTCSIRENAESKIWERLNYLKSVKKKRKSKKMQGLHLQVGVLGCMAERLKHKLLDANKMVDLVAGPDAYRDLPRLLSISEESNQHAVNVMLSLEETYADVVPVRLNQQSVSAFVSIMRGCDNMCSYCIVPFTRGRERSRPIQSIVEEIELLSEQGVKEITLLGQNVNSYRDKSDSSYILFDAEEDIHSNVTKTSRGFKTIYKPKIGGLRFYHLLERVAKVNPEIRIRFTSPHPKDFPDELLSVIKDIPNVCNALHLPAQSGNTAVLERMRRGYTKEAYLDLVELARCTIPGVTISSDFIAGFCGETEQEHNDTVALLKHVNYDMAYMFAYSMREKTHAYHRLTDDVPEDIKLRRLQEIIRTFHQTALVAKQEQIGQHHLILVEKLSKRSKDHYQGRNDGNTIVIFPKEDIPCRITSQAVLPQPGDYVAVKITGCTKLTLQGKPLYRTTLQEFTRASNHHNADFNLANALHA